MDQNPLQHALLGIDVEKLATSLFGNATTRMKNFLRDHGDEPITSIVIGRVPISKAIASAMSLVTSGAFDRQKSKKGYDDFFHLFIIINDKYRLEKNQNVNVMTDYKPVENEERFNVSLGGLSGKSINDFVNNGVEKMGETDYWGNYDALQKNCQNWVMQNLKANDVFTQAVQDFAFQDTNDLQLEVSDYVKGGLKEVTNIASGLDKFLSWLSGGRFGLKQGGKVYGMPKYAQGGFIARPDEAWKYMKEQREYDHAYLGEEVVSSLKDKAERAWKEFNDRGSTLLTNTNYVGPFNSLTPEYIQSHPPKNQVDRTAMVHDQEYSDIAKRRDSGQITPEEAKRLIRESDDKFLTNTSKYAKEDPWASSLGFAGIWGKTQLENLGLLNPNKFVTAKRGMHIRKFGI